MNVNGIDVQFFGADERSGSVFVVQTRATAGTMLQSHKHDHGHLSVLVSGTAEVVIDGARERMTGYRLVTVPPGTYHEIHAVTDVVWLCLWSAAEVSLEQMAGIEKVLRDAA